MVKQPVVLATDRVGAFVTAGYGYRELYYHWEQN